jgi:hypothetical protein
MFHFHWLVYDIYEWAYGALATGTSSLHAHSFPTFHGLVSCYNEIVLSNKSLLLLVLAYF